MSAQSGKLGQIIRNFAIVLSAGFVWKDKFGQ
ncbi:hypothetical protein IOK_05391 [Yersinia enterocolitica subsp. palearctica PhRBD_Ye1]|nr:hypothetical protein IOK_05391 [Yersinia enterocolitica subsp. palearctica PhRBD_Ye1]